MTTSTHFRPFPRPFTQPSLAAAAASQRLPVLTSARLTAAEIALAAPEASASAPDSAESFDALPLGAWSSSRSLEGGGAGRGGPSSSWRLALRTAASPGPAWQAVAFERVVLPERAKLFIYPCAQEETGEEKEGLLLRRQQRRRRRECPRPASCDPPPQSAPPPPPPPFSPPPPPFCFSVSSEDLRRLRAGGGPLISSAVPGGTAVVEVWLPSTERGRRRRRRGGGDEGAEEGGEEEKEEGLVSTGPSEKPELRVAAVLRRCTSTVL